jgi:hypothetical protein
VSVTRQGVSSYDLSAILDQGLRQSGDRRATAALRAWFA